MTVFQPEIGSYSQGRREAFQPSVSFCILNWKNFTINSASSEFVNKHSSDGESSSQTWQPSKTSKNLIWHSAGRHAEASPAPTTNTLKVVFFFFFFPLNASLSEFKSESQMLLLCGPAARILCQQITFLQNTATSEADGRQPTVLFICHLLQQEVVTKATCGLDVFKDTWRHFQVFEWRPKQVNSDAFRFPRTTWFMQRKEPPCFYLRLWRIVLVLHSLWRLGVL